MIPFSLTVRREELQEALKILAKVVKPKQAGKAVFTFSAGFLEIKLPGSMMRVPAEGTWLGAVKTGGREVLRLSQQVPEEDPLPLLVKNGRLYFSGFSLPCTVEATEPLL
jgi:hypothetical protein